MRGACHVRSCATCFYMVCLHPCSASVPSCTLHGLLREKLVTYQSPFHVSGGRGHAIAPAVRLLLSILDLGARAPIVIVQHHHFRNQRRLRIKPNILGMLEVPHERPFRFKTDAPFWHILAHSSPSRHFRDMEVPQNTCGSRTFTADDKSLYNIK